MCGPLVRHSVGGTYILKAFSERFGTDAVELRNFTDLSRPRHGSALWGVKTSLDQAVSIHHAVSIMDYIRRTAPAPCRRSVLISIHPVRPSYFLHQRGVVNVARFQDRWAMRRPLQRGTSIRLSSTFFLCMPVNRNKTHLFIGS